MKQTKTLLWPLQFAAALILLITSPLIQAQISVGPSGAGPLTFDTTPSAAELSTFVLNGTATTFADAATLDATAAGLTVAGINAISRQLPTSTTVPPTTFSGGFRHNNGSGLYVQSRPTTDGTNAAGAMLGTFINNSGSARSSVNISYDFNSFNPATGHLPGFNVYYSLTGEAGSWTPIPELTGSETVGSALVNLNLGSWAVGANLYVLWLDDNADGITDPSYTIDNLRIAFVVDPPSITQPPVGGTVTEGRSFTFTVLAAGPGLIYSWQKAGFGEVGTGSSLTISNATAADAGQYFVSITNPGGNVSSPPVTLDVAEDTAAPVFLLASGSADNINITVRVDEPLCDDITLACASGTVTSYATDPFAWSIVNPDNPFDTPSIVGIALQNETNLVFTTSGLTAGQSYRVVMVGASGSVGDKFGNGIAVDTFIDILPTIGFQQNLNGYVGTQDAEIHSNASADTTLGLLGQVGVDNDDAGIARGLLRFDNIFGTNPGQIPPSAEIISATLTLNQIDAGSPANLHRMLIDWNQTSATWNLFNEGVTNDGIEAAVASDVLATAGTPIVINVTSSVQAWADGQPNFGWVMISTGTDGWDWSSSESGTPPLLTVTYKVVPCTEAPVITAQPPAALNPTEGSAFSITVGVDVCLPTFQWTKDNVDLPGANGSTLTVASAVAGAGGSSGTYRLRVTNPNGTVTSSATAVTVIPDTTRPVLTRAVSASSTTVVLNFNKVLNSASAQTIGNYTISGGATVSAAVVSNGANNATVTLTTSARPVGFHTLTIAGVTDNRASANVINPDPTTVSLTTVQVIDSWASNWSYNTNNLDAFADWTTMGGDGWLTGNGLFGTEPQAATLNLPAPIATAIPPPNLNNEFLTSYFRKSVSLPPLPAGSAYALTYITDDGAVFYIDGAEIGRFNMPAGAVTYSTVALAAAPEGVLLPLHLSTAAGNHTIAVSVHQSVNTSSDALFGMQILIIPTPAPSLSIGLNGTNVVVSWPGDFSWELTGSTNVAGPYIPVANAPFRSLTTPAAQSHQFYQLRYRPQH